MIRTIRRTLSRAVTTTLLMSYTMDSNNTYIARGKSRTALYETDSDF